MGEIVAAVTDHYGKLTRRIRSAQMAPKEWTSLAAFVVTLSTADASSSSDEAAATVTAPLPNRTVEVVSLATGTKCLGASAMSERGDVLNDSHAEILARRGFLRFLYGEMRKALDGKSRILELCTTQSKFRIVDGLEVHLVTSHTPCGDASIFPVQENDLQVIQRRKRQKDGALSEKPIKRVRRSAGVPEKDTSNSPGDSADDIHRTGARCVSTSFLQDSLRRGGEYHVRGALRTKPGRGERTLSMSCSDKIMKWNCLGLQGSLLFRFLEQPVYLTSVVVLRCPFNQKAVSESLVNRADNVALPVDSPFRLQRPAITSRDILFVHGKHYADLDYDASWKPSPKSVVWWNSGKAVERTTECLINGRKLGATKCTKSSFSSRSMLCKLEFFRLYTDLRRDLASRFLIDRKSASPEMANSVTYVEAKRSSEMYSAARQAFMSSFPEWTSKPTKLSQFRLE